LPRTGKSYRPTRNDALTPSTVARLRRSAGRNWPKPVRSEMFEYSLFCPRLCNVRIVLRLGDPDFQAKIVRVLPIGFAGIGDAAAISIFKVIWQAVAVIVERVAAAIGRNVVKPNVQRCIGL